ncbi:hypothetical protein WA026_008001 [Henosepilachna vigintioctopunctata]|uniref:Uncharacterized protein n=1 Tax=Henosepilachna vigintioctopunctata TaxID=420089 RepID=A0AAW1TIE7_9CUCU
MEVSKDEIEGLMNLFNTGPRRRYKDSDEEELEEAQPNNDAVPNNETDVIEKKNPYAKLDPIERKEQLYREFATENEFLQMTIRHPLIGKKTQNGKSVTNNK